MTRIRFPTASSSAAAAILLVALSFLGGPCTRGVVDAFTFSGRKVDRKVDVKVDSSSVVLAASSSTSEQGDAAEEGYVGDTRRTFFTRATKLATGTATAATTATVLLTNPSPSLASTGTGTTSLTHPLLGKKAPKFELPNSRGDGTTTTLDSLTSQKKWTVLYFYPGAFTQGCTLEARNFQRDIETYRKLNAQIVGVSVDPPETNSAFCSSEGLDFYMLSDAGGKVSELYGSALTVPGVGSFSNRQTYVIDNDGYLRHIFTDVESRVPRHSSDVIEKLEEEEGLIYSPVPWAGDV